jgi:hypothetical protein
MQQSSAKKAFTGASHETALQKHAAKVFGATLFTISYHYAHGMPHSNLKDFFSLPSKINVS